MALVLKDRVLETSQTSGTGTLTLAGPVNNFQSFSSAIGNGNTTYYAIVDDADNQWEVGIGTVSASALSRDTVYASSNGGAKVNFGASIKQVFCDYPASKVISLDSNGNPSFGGNSYQDYASISAPSYLEGRTWYDSTAHALAYYNDSANAIVHIGQDLQIKVINNTGSTIANGSPVYITGTSSGQTYPNVALAKADVAATSSVIGLTNGAIANGAIGYVTGQGTIDGVNTGTFTVGQVLYLSPYSAGQLMNTIPPTGITVQVGVVSYVNSSAGKIYVKQTTPLAVPASIITGVLPIANGGTNATTASDARTNLGLGTIATQNANAVAITGGTIDNTPIGATTPSTGTFTTITGQTETINGTGMNLVIYSQNYAFWNPNALTVTANSTTAPDSTNTGSLLTSNGATTQHYITQSGTAGTASSFYPRTWSCYLKAGTNNFAQLLFGSDVNGYANFNLSTGVIGTVGSSVTATITDAGSGWYRCSITTSSTTANSSVYVAIVTGTTAARFESNSLSTTIFAWGAQFEYGSTARAYVVTTTAIVYNTPQLQFNNSPILQLQSDGSVVVQPAGTGALQAQATTSSTVGGNARGANSIDFQTSRTTASQVASGTTSFIGSGRNNTVVGGDNSIVGGYQNSISGGAQNVISGGATNSISAGVSGAGVLSGQSNVVGQTYSAIVGGANNTANGYYNFIGGGQLNSGTASAAATTQSGTMNATTAVTLSGSNASIKVGQLITGTSIAFPTYVAAISGTSLTLSQAANGSSTSTLSFCTPHGVVVGGGNNQATGSYSFIGGGGDAGTAANRNVASGAWSFVGGGAKNVASGAGSVVVGGGTDGGGNYFANTASGANSFIGGGWNNTASGSFVFVGGGTSNNASSGSILGNANHTSNGNNSSVIGGSQGTTRGLSGVIAFPACNTPVANGAGFSQASMLVLGRQTTDATATVLCSDANAASGINQVILPNNSAYYFKVSVIAGVTGAGNTKAWTLEGAIKRGAGVGTTAIVGTVTTTIVAADVGAATWTVTATADTTNGGLVITFTGQAATTIRVVAKCETAEMTF